MNKRDETICRAILNFLDSLDGGLANEVLIHAGLNEGMQIPPNLSELERCIKHCDTRKWIKGVVSPINNKTKWGIREEGRAALLEM